MILDIVWRGDIGSNCDFPSNDFKQVQMSQSTECERVCRETDGCTSYTFNPNSRTCFLKNKLVDKSNAVFRGEWLDKTFFGIICGIISKSITSIIKISY